MSSLKSTVSALVIVGACVAPAVAQENEEAKVRRFEPVVVTAQKREQLANDVGISITARSGAELRAAGVVESKDILRIAPGVLLDSTASSGVASNLTMRGVSQSDYSAIQESPNSMYIDEVYLASSGAAAFPIYDLDRVEVLRGPQGTLFGRASSGGLASFFSKRPTDEFEGYVDVGYGSFNSMHAEGAVSGPLSDKARFRISTRAEKADGWWENKNPGGRDTLENEFYGIRGQLEVDITSQLTANLIVSYDKKPKQDAGIYKAESFYIDGAGQPAPLPENLDAYGTGPGNDFVGYRDPYNDASVGSFNNVGFFENEKFSPTLILNWSGDNVDITSVTNYTEFSFDYNEDCDGGPYDYCQFPFNQDLNQFSQELRATGTNGPLLWTVGAYYLNIAQDSGINFEFPLLSGSDFSFSDSNVISQDTDSYAVFGQVEYELNDKLKMTVGGRYTRDERSIDSKVYFFELGNGYSGGTGTTIFDPPLVVYDFSAATVGELATVQDDLWSGKVQLDYKPTDDALLYVSASRGVKGPGFNTNVSGNLTNSETPFNSEKLNAYEAGAKLGLFDRRMQLNASTFYYDYQDFQGFAFNGLQGVVGNYDGKFYGGELEFSGSPVDTVNVFLGLSYLQTELQDIPTAYNGVRDQEGVLAPEWTVNGLIDKTFDIGPGMVALQWSFDFVDDRYTSIDNNAATFVEGSFVHNARISYDLPDKGIELAAFVDNISDEDRNNYTFDLISSGGFVIRSYAKPRWWGVSIRKSF